MKTALLALVSLAACTRPPPRAPIALPGASVQESRSGVVEESRSGVVIMSMHDVEPYEHVPPPTPKPPPPIEFAAPVYGALSGAVFGLVLHTGYTLLTEHRMPSDRKLDRDRANKALLYGAGIGLAAGTYGLVNSIAERAKWRRERDEKRDEKQR
jgi:hypothetical protein